LRSGGNKFTDEGKIREHPQLDTRIRLRADQHERSLPRYVRVLAPGSGAVLAAGLVLLVADARWSARADTADSQVKPVMMLARCSGR
jgi:hypothetical protein